jgi:hypothetical protein
MQRREFIATVAASCAALKSFADKAGEKPNVLFLMSDEHSGRVMGCTGGAIVKTPVFDALAESGVNFKSAYCQKPGDNNIYFSGDGGMANFSVYQMKSIWKDSLQ